MDISLLTIGSLVTLRNGLAAIVESAPFFNHVWVSLDDGMELEVSLYEIIAID